MSPRLDSNRPNTRPAALPQQFEGGGITPAFVLYCIGRWWLIAGCCGLVMAMIAAAIVWMMFEPTYRATAWLKIEDRKPKIVFDLQDDSRLFVETQIELIRSPLVLGRVLAEPAIAELPEIATEVEPLAYLAKHVQVKSVGRSELFHILVEGPNPESAAKIANSVQSQYIQVQEEMTDTQTQRTIELLDQEQKRRFADLNRMQQNLKELAKLITGKEPALIHEERLGLGLQTPLNALQERLASIEVRRELLEARQAALEEHLDKQDAPSKVMIERAVDQLPQVQEMLAAQTAMQAKLHETENALADKNHAVLVRMRNELEKSKKSLTELRQTLAKEQAGEIAQQLRREQESNREQLATQIGDQKLEEKMLLERLEKQRAELETLGDHSLELEFARSELGRAQEVHDRIADRTMALKTELEAPARITLLEPATAPTVPLKANPLKEVLLAVSACFAFPFLLAVAWEFKASRVSDSQQISKNVQLPVLGEVTSLPTRALIVGRKGSAWYERQRSTFEESIDQLRTAITLASGNEDLKVIVVTSAVSGEGKTSLSSQLAVSLARASREKVLLIDTDLRSPDVHDLFSLPLGPGLSDVLERRISAKEAIVKNWSEYLHILPAGRLTTNPHSLFSGKEYEAFLDEVKPDYRYIVIDSPPLLAASEAYVVANKADGAVLCAMRDISRAPQVKLACEKLLAAGGRPLGLVLSGVPTSTYTNYYGTYAYGSPAAAASS